MNKYLKYLAVSAGIFAVLCALVLLGCFTWIITACVINGSML